MGLFIAVTSYNGMVSFNVTSCRRTLPDIELFMDCMRESFAELKDAVAKLPKTSKKPKASKKRGSRKKATKKRKAVKKVSALPKNRKKRAKKN